MNDSKPPEFPEYPEYPVNKTREYEKSGLYPKNGKAFRIWALLGVLAFAIAVMAAAAGILNMVLI